MVYVHRLGVMIETSYSENCYLFKKIFQCLFIFERETQSMSRGGAERERERETQNPKPAPGSELSAQSLMRGSNSRARRS